MEYYCSVGIQCSVGDCSGFFFVGKNTTTTWTRDHVQYKGLPFARTTYEPLHSVLFLNMKHIRVFSADAHSNEILKQDVRHCGSFRARNMTMWWNFTKETKHNSLTVADGRAQKETVDPPIKVHFRTDRERNIEKRFVWHTQICTYASTATKTKKNRSEGDHTIE